MAKGSVRKKGRKWYYRFYVEDASGNLVQKEYAGTESKSETEKLLRQAMEDYESKRFVAKAENLTLGQLLDVWVEEELKTGTLSNGTVSSYLNAVAKIKQHPIGKRKLKTITAEHLQDFINLLSFGGEAGDFKSVGYSKSYLRAFSAVLHQSFRFAVFPKQYITFNPMEYVQFRGKAEKETELFAEESEHDGTVVPITHEQYLELMEYLDNRNNPAKLAFQISYFTGLRIGEVCGLSWQDINLEEQYLTVRRSIHYNDKRKRTEIGATKRKKIRVVDFCDTLAEILREAKKAHRRQVFHYGELYRKNYYHEVHEKNRIYYDVYTLDGQQLIPDDYRFIDLVCIRPDGSLEAPHTIQAVCNKIKHTLSGFENFHFHVLRHTYTTNLLAYGAQPKDVQELLGHSDVSTTLNIYAHATRETKRKSARLLDQVVGA